MDKGQGLFTCQGTSDLVWQQLVPQRRWIGDAGTPQMMAVALRNAIIYGLQGP